MFAVVIRDIESFYMTLVGPFEFIDDAQYYAEHFNGDENKVAIVKKMMTTGEYDADRQ